jgi:proline dehydrogenase
LYVVPTVQNYLKRSLERTEYEIEIANRKNLIFGAKLVRGAYIVEETKIANQTGTDNVVVDSFEATTKNYLASFKAILEKARKGEVVVATHNQDTILSTSEILNETKTTIGVCYAQLLGLADHLTFESQKQGFKVYKYLPWAKSEVMVGYMIRRA